MQTEKPSQKAVTAALKVMERRLSALNEQNPTALAATLHFPHFHLLEQASKFGKQQTLTSMISKLVLENTGHIQN